MILLFMISFLAYEYNYIGLSILFCKELLGFFTVLTLLPGGLLENICYYYCGNSLFFKGLNEQDYLGKFSNLYLGNNTYIDQNFLVLKSCLAWGLSNHNFNI